MLNLMHTNKSGMSMKEKTITKVLICEKGVSDHSKICYYSNPNNLFDKDMKFVVILKADHGGCLFFFLQRKNVETCKNCLCRSDS